MKERRILLAAVVLFASRAFGQEAVPPKPAAEKFSFLTPERDAYFRRLIIWPTVRDNPHTYIYSDREVTPAYQFDHNGMSFHAVNYNISANGSEPFGNGNREFPWNAPGGAHRCTNVRSFKFFTLPKKSDGTSWPIVYWGGNGKEVSWVFPIGTVLGEALIMDDESRPDVSRVFETRTRQRVLNDWVVAVWRQWPDADTLIDAIQNLRDNWQETPELVRLVKHLRDPATLKKDYRLSDRNHPTRGFEAVADVDELPEIPAADVDQLTETGRFYETHGQNFRGNSGCPTTKAKWHVVPANYDAGFINQDQASCQKCHESVQKQIRLFDGRRDWYGNVRGSDESFSLHPALESSISHNGYAAPQQMRDVPGVFERFDPVKHPQKKYSVIDRSVKVADDGFRERREAALATWRKQPKP